MTVLEQGNITIHTANIFETIKRALYSDHDIFLRELVSNAVDAIQKLKMVSYSGEFSGEVGEPEISIEIDKGKRTLTISDNGIGMTAEEIKKYINQVAFSSAEEFMEKYQGGNDQPIIGHFGLGFYSAFIVASQVEIDTRSWRSDAQAVRWTCDGSPSFELSSSERSSRGTSIILHLGEGEDEFLEEARIRTLVSTYCDFMPVPIKLHGEVLNQQKAIWRESASNLTKDDYLEFYRYLYPFQEDPVLWVHLNTDYPYQVNGVLYFPKLRPDVDPTQGQIKLFCNQVFVSDHCEEIVPRFLLPMRGVIDSPDIPLNVSRSALQLDRKVRSIAGFIAKKVGDRLKELWKDDKAEYIRSWQDLGTFIKFGCLNDEKFKDQVREFLIFRSSANLSESSSEDKGQDAENRWYTTLQAYLERNKERHENRVYYCTDPAAQATYVELFRSKGLEVLYADAFIDTHFLPFLEQEYTDVRFSRVDAELDETLVDKQAETEIIDPTTNKTRSELIRDAFEAALDNKRINVKTEALAGDASAPPAMVLLPEAARRMQEMSAFMTQEGYRFPDDHILLVNTAHPLVQNVARLSQGAIIGADGSSPTQELARQLCRHVYDLALIAQKGFDADGMKAFTERSNQVLTRLTELAAR